MSQPFRPSFPNPLPVFECRSQVGALKVRAKVPTGSGYDLHFEDNRFPVLSVGRDFEWPYLILREIDQAGGYVVRFEPDGDVFFVRGELFDALGFKAAQEGTDGFEPAAAFEAGYSLVEDGNDGRLVVLREDFDVGQWWVKELDAMAANGTPDQKRAVAVVRNLLGQIADGEVRLIGPATQAAREVGK